jgi:hypothetical protein
VTLALILCQIFLAQIIPVPRAATSLLLLCTGLLLCILENAKTRGHFLPGKATSNHLIVARFMAEFGAWALPNERESLLRAAHAGRLAPHSKYL